MIGPELPEVVYERFQHPPLRVMLGQVQFPIILRLQKGVEAIADFQDAIRDVFPGFGMQHQFQITVSPTGAPDATAQEAPAYRFLTEDQTWSALLAPTGLTLEAAVGDNYSSYDDFARLFRALWSAAVDHLRPGKITQQGLRYVDHIEGDRPASEWAKWINPELLGAIAGKVLGSGLEQSMCELVYLRDSGRLVFRHGMAAAGPANVKGYLLDFDDIHTEPLQADDADALMARFDESHELLYKFFRWCVTEKALEEFGRAGT